jgi:hypothetical protein
VPVCQAGVRRTQPPVELDRAADVRVGHVLEPLLAELAATSVDRHHLRAVRLPMSTMSP